MDNSTTVPIRFWDIHSMIVEDMTITDNLTKSPVDPNQIQGSVFLFVFYIFQAIIGSLANSFVIMTITLNPTFWKASYYYITNVAVADFMSCTICAPYNAYVLTQIYPPEGCEVIGALTTLFSTVSLISLSAVAVNRFVLLRRNPDDYQEMYSIPRISLSIFIIWILASCSLLPSLTGHSKAGFDAKIGLCISTISDGQTYLYEFLSAALIGVTTLTVTYICYIKVWRIFKRSVDAVQLNADKATRDKFRLTRNLFIVTFVFTLCWLPNILLNIFDYQHRATIIAHQTTSALALSHSFLNPLLYIFLNRNFLEIWKSNCSFNTSRVNCSARCCNQKETLIRPHASQTPHTSVVVHSRKSSVVVPIDVPLGNDTQQVNTSLGLHEKPI